jgi:hypothetical protein
MAILIITYFAFLVRTFTLITLKPIIFLTYNFESLTLHLHYQMLIGISLKFMNGYLLKIDFMKVLEVFLRNQTVHHIYLF